MSKIDVKSLDFQELEKHIQEWNIPKFRAKQIYQWLHQKLVRDFAEMTNLPKEFREQLAESFDLVSLLPVDIKISKIDGTRKYLFALDDGNIIESVLMKYKHGNSVCISSQVGCRMGCKFCASTLDGLERNLKPSEMLDQIYYIQKAIKERVSHVVVMGSGEPLDNYDNLLKFITLLSNQDGLSISQRNITISTCGLVPEIIRLSKESLQITLALSLHAPNDEIRKGLMPIAARYKLPEIIDACEEYFKQTGRRITYEYSLIKGVNDTKAEAKALAQLLKGKAAHVNLIPVNPIKERDFVQSDYKFIVDFKNVLEKYRINATIRREMGRDIQGACGQLRKSFIDKKDN